MIGDRERRGQSGRFDAEQIDQSNDAVVDGLDDLFGIRVESSYVSKLRRRAVERYRPT